MTIRTLILAAALAVAAWTMGCGPAVTLRVLEPAAVTVPPQVETVALVDRSRPSNAGEGILGVLEGIVTGEAIGVDTEGRAQALQGLSSGLANSPRFRVVKTITSRHMLALQALGLSFSEVLDPKHADLTPWTR